MSGILTIDLPQAAKIARDPAATESARRWARGMMYSIYAHVEPLLGDEAAERLARWIAAEVDLSKSVSP